MLLRRARDIAHRDAVPGAAAPGEGQIQQIANFLLERHDYDHRDQWDRIRGGHVCEECDDFLDKYILQCRQCMLQACRRCAHTRFGWE